MTFHDDELGVRYEHNPIKNNLPVVGLVALPADSTVNDPLDKTLIASKILKPQCDYSNTSDTQNFQQAPTLTSMDTAMNPEYVHQQSSSYINQAENETPSKQNGQKKRRITPKLIKQL
ncbi:14588_t:CDS:1 [Acaulospora colombiana]|uniref:14588_t:CDS:1 n=1 Tax=Acaulospora colombiana TaxID=27376 RepID=A0ACA9NJG1_9GLOM|nr:14588_t:CDS:1 [Acaulospora colombiana]